MLAELQGEVAAGGRGRLSARRPPDRLRSADDRDGPGRCPTRTPPLAARLRGVQSSPVREILALTERPGMISFAGGLPAPGAVRRCRACAPRSPRCCRDEAAGRSLQYSTTEGDPALRAAVAARLTARGLPTGADELLITSGSQQALTLIATVLLEPGDTVLVEEPSYLAALQAFQLAGATRRAGPVRRRRARSRGRGGAGRAPRRAAALHDPDVPEPDRSHAPARPPRGARRARAPRRLLAARGRPVRRAALPRRRACRRWRRSTAACCRSRRCRRSRRPGCGSAGCARPSRCAGR